LFETEHNNKFIAQLEQFEIDRTNPVTLVVKVWEADRFTCDDKIGTATLDLRPMLLEPGKLHEQTLFVLTDPSMEGSMYYGGDVHLTMYYDEENKTLETVIVGVNNLQNQDLKIKGNTTLARNALIIVVIYLIIGAIYYTQVEQWSLVNSLYFCFITLTTIGYGDHESYKHPYTMMVTTFFVMVGIILIAGALGIVGGFLIDNVTGQVASVFPKEVKTFKTLKTLKILKTFKTFKKLKIFNTTLYTSNWSVSSSKAENKELSQRISVVALRSLACSSKRPMCEKSTVTLG
jgi:hypothetical protein